MSHQINNLLRKGNLQEQRNKDFSLKIATILLLVLVTGFLTGIITYKVIAEPASLCQSTRANT